MGTCAFSQSTGTLRFHFEPEAGVSYVLDGKYRMSDREVTLMEGSHRFVFWAPERGMLDTALAVAGGRTTDVHLRLRYAWEFIDHRRAVERHERDKRWARALPPVLMAGAGIWAGTRYLRYVKAHDRLEELDESYRILSDPAAITRLKAEDIPAAKDDFAKARTGAIVSGGVFAASLAATLYIRHRAARAKPPVYEDKERVRFEGLAWVPGAPGGTWAAGLSIPLR